MLIDRLISRVKFDLIEFPGYVQQTLTISNVNQITLIQRLLNVCIKFKLLHVKLNFAQF